jgi:hypothetical protein
MSEVSNPWDELLLEKTQPFANLRRLTKLNKHIHYYYLMKKKQGLSSLKTADTLDY